MECLGSPSPGPKSDQTREVYGKRKMPSDYINQFNRNEFRVKSRDESLSLRLVRFQASYLDMLFCYEIRTESSIRFQK